MESAAPRPRTAPARLALVAAAFLACGAVHTDPREAGPDYALQGEYAGPGRGAQVIALGEGRFEVALHAGGLPGAGWDGSPRVRVQGSRQGDEVVFADGAALRDGMLRGKTVAGADFSLRKVMRESPTLGAPAPPGATVLFDGSGPGGFDGELDGQGNLEVGAVTRERFSDFELHLEFRIPFMPDYRGQQRGNSGVYLQNRYEIQVLDSFGLAGAIDECGALYAQRAPEINMAFPPLRWQTYDVLFRAARFDAAGRRVEPARVGLRHNGVPVHEGVSLTGPMDGGDAEGPEPGPIHFQDLWIPVAYRNVWIRPLPGAPGPP